jgi:biopolymer transport protein TolQ
MDVDLSLLTLISQASLVVKLVMSLLLLASIASWAVIIEKSRMLKQSIDAANAFESRFWSGGDLSTMYRELAQSNAKVPGMAGIFEAGFREFGRLKKQAGATAERIIDGARRSMRVSQMREVDRLENNLSFLATVGSTSPYVGLFGTVWGIMNSFQSLGNVQSATLALVAPGIAEALIATAMGLFAAIPAVIFFNRFADKVSRLEVRFDTFTEEFSSILQRHATVSSEPSE